ncbi:hypothetical protein ACFL6C_05875 [Myxococcota bacterium]
MRKTALLLLVPMAACGEDKKDGPKFTQRMFDESITQAMTAFEEVEEETWEARDLDFASCPVDPAPDGSFCTFQAQIIDFQEDEFQVQLGGTTVKVFPSNRIQDLDVTCASVTEDCPTTQPVCWEDEADAAGRLDVPCIPCNTRFAVWAYKKSTVAPVTKKAVEFDRWVDNESEVEDVFTISNKTYDLIPGIVGFDPDPNLGIVAGQAQDCAGNTIGNLATNVDRGLLTEPSNPEFAGDDVIYGVGTFYFVNNFPQKNQTVTSEDGLWSFVNVPPGEITVFGSGRRADNSPVEQNVGRVTLAAFPDTIAIGDLWIEASK